MISKVGARSDLRVLSAIVKKELLIYTRYPLSILRSIIDPLFWALILVGAYYMFIGPSGNSPTLFETFTGTRNYPAYAFVGFLIIHFFNEAVYMVAGLFRIEQQAGTLESNFLAPVPPWIFILGKALVVAITSAITGLFVIIIGLITAGITFQTSSAYLIITIIILVLGASFGIGLLFSSLIMLYREVQESISFIVYIQVSFSGFSFAIAALPEVLRYFAYIFPATWAIEAMRAVLIYNSSLSYISYLMVILLAFDFMLISLGFIMLRRFERAAKLGGGLGAY